MFDRVGNTLLVLLVRFFFRNFIRAKFKEIPEGVTRDLMTYLLYITCHVKVRAEIFIQEM